MVPPGSDGETLPFFPMGILETSHPTDSTLLVWTGVGGLSLKQAQTVSIVGFAALQPLSPLLGSATVT